MDVDVVRAALDRLEEATGVTIAHVDVDGGDRAAEHGAGRAAVRAAFGRAGAGAPGDVGRHDDGRPRWPGGWTGSIAHGDGIAVAAVAPSATHHAVGIDVERHGALAVDEAVLVLDEAERAWARSAPAATLLWSAKESAFKAWATAAGGLDRVDPVDIHIAVEMATGRLTASAHGPLAARTSGPLTGAFAVVRGRVVTVMVDR